MAVLAQGLSTQVHGLTVPRQGGTLDIIHDLFRQRVRTAEEPYSPRTTASVDSQSVDTISGGEQRSRDNAKSVGGRKRHILADPLGLLLAVLVTAASVDDAKAAAELLGRLGGQPVGEVTQVFAGGNYHHYAPVRLAMNHLTLNRLEPKDIDAEFQYHSTA